MNDFTSILKEKQREYVVSSYNTAEKDNSLLYAKGDIKATEEYIYDNQKTDACNIVHTFYNTNCRVISIQKKTKVGADGLMIEIATKMATHPDDGFITNIDNVRIITGMSNMGWEKDIKDKVPVCLKDKIFHHGKLLKSNMSNLTNGLIIIDEIDTGDKEYQKLHTQLMENGLLDIKHMQEKNNRFIFISATCIQQLNELYKWGDFHASYKMTIPESYIGHKEFLDRGIIKEFYDLNSVSKVKKWIDEDILGNYGNDYRIHFVRVKKNIQSVHQGCNEKGVIFKNHTSEDRITKEELGELFQSKINRHVVIGIKGFFRRANLIPNNWKVRIGATHELYTKKVDYNVQIQGLPGRLTGYWREILDSGHKTGPYRTSVEAVKNYDANYNDPTCENDYKTIGFMKKRGRIKTIKPTFVDPNNIENLEICTSRIEMNNNDTVPVKLEINDSALLNELVNLRTNSRSGYKIEFHRLLLEGITNRGIIVYDNNRQDKKFDVNRSSINTVRMYKTGDDASSRRFRNFSSAFDNLKQISHTCNTGQYNVDFAKDRFELYNFVNETHIFWITFKL